MKVYNTLKKFALKYICSGGKKAEKTFQEYKSKYWKLHQLETHSSKTTLNTIWNINNWSVALNNNCHNVFCGKKCYDHYSFSAGAAAQVRGVPWPILTFVAMVTWCHCHHDGPQLPHHPHRHEGTFFLFIYVIIFLAVTKPIMAISRICWSVSLSPVFLLGSVHDNFPKNWGHQTSVKLFLDNGLDEMTFWHGSHGWP